MNILDFRKAIKDLKRVDQERLKKQYKNGEITEYIPRHKYYNEDMYQYDPKAKVQKVYGDPIVIDDLNSIVESIDLCIDNLIKIPLFKHPRDYVGDLPNDTTIDLSDLDDWIRL